MSNHAVFQPGQVVFREGENSQEAYRILRGRVEISIVADGKPVILAQLGEGDILGRWPWWTSVPVRPLPRHSK